MLRSVKRQAVESVAKGFRFGDWRFQGLRFRVWASEFRGCSNLYGLDKLLFGNLHASWEAFGPPFIFEV